MSKPVITPQLLNERDAAKLASSRRGHESMSKQFFTLGEIADRWSCCHSSVLSLVKTGQLTAIDISTRPSGRSRFIVRADDLDDFESRRTVSKKPSIPSKRRAKIERADIIEFIR